MKKAGCGQGVEYSGTVIRTRKCCHTNNPIAFSTGSFFLLYRSMSGTNDVARLLIHRETEKFTALTFDYSTNRRQRSCYVFSSFPPLYMHVYAKLHVVIHHDTYVRLVLLEYADLGLTFGNGPLPHLTYDAETRTPCNICRSF